MTWVLFEICSFFAYNNTEWAGVSKLFTGCVNLNVDYDSNLD